MPENCRECLRYSHTKKRCGALKKKLDPCFGYIDDPIEYRKQQREHVKYIVAKTGNIPKELIENIMGGPDGKKVKLS